MDLKLLQKNLQKIEVSEETAESLNKHLSILTPANIEMVLYDAKLLKINSAECLEKCVDVIFENAINNESQKLFAELCTKLLLASVHVCKETQKMITFKEQICEKARIEVQNFLEQQTIIMKEQKKDEKSESSGIGETPCMKKLRRPIALFRFIGELYLFDFIPSSLIKQCFPAIVDETFCNENSLETFCALLKIAGKKLEIIELHDCTELFKVLEVRKVSVPMSPHTRFMIEEIFEMRKNRWEPVNEVDWIMLYNLFLCDVEEKLYVLELWYGK